MTTEYYLTLSVCLSAVFPIFYGISLLISSISDVIKEHRSDYRLNSQPYTVKDAKHLFCDFYKNASQFDVYELDDYYGYFVMRKKCIEKDFDNPVDDEDDTPICFYDVNGNMSDIE